MPTLLLTLLGNRIAQLGLALLIGYGWGWWKTDTSWRESVARERAAAEAAYQIEIQRQRAATAEIAAEATQRLEYETTRANDMAARIKELQLAEARHEPETRLECKDKAGQPVVVRPCRLDRDDIDWLRRLDAAGRAPHAPGAAGNIRARR